MKKILTLSLTSLALTALIAQGAVIQTNATQDTYVRSDSPNNAYGTDTTLLVGGHASVGPFNSFYKFTLDLTGLQVGDSIDSVILRLTSINSAGSGTVNINLYQLAAANAVWKEGVSGTVPTGTSDTGATFNNRAGQGAFAVAWAGGNSNANLVAGTDYVNTVLGNFSGGTNTATGGQTFDFGNAAFTSLVQGAITSTLELNLILMDQTSGTNFLRIASSENSTYSAPQLIVNYTVIPEPGTLALVGVALGSLLLFRRRK